MPWKMDGDHVALDGGHPVWVSEGGEAKPVDFGKTLDRITQLNGEAKGHRERAEQFEAKLKIWEPLGDPEAAKTALETVKNLKDKQILDAGGVKQIRDETRDAVKGEYEPRVREYEALVAALSSENLDLKLNTTLGEAVGAKVKGADGVERPVFRMSIATAKSVFGKHFVKNDDGTVTPYYDPDKKLHPVVDSMGEPATPAEALRKLVEKHPDKSIFLAGVESSGSGTTGSQGSGGGAVISRAEFNNLSPQAQQDFFKKGGKLATA